MVYLEPAEMTIFILTFSLRQQLEDIHFVLFSVKQFTSCLGLSTGHVEHLLQISGYYRVNLLFSKLCPDQHFIDIALGL